MQVATTIRPDTVAKVEALTDRLFSYVRKDGKERFFVGRSIERVFTSAKGNECVTMEVFDTESHKKAFKTFHVSNIHFFCA